jgi:hypothetical protein
LRRSHIVASHQHYIGKETSRRWEQGDDMSMVDFVATEYSECRTVADQKLRDRILKNGIRKTARETQLDTKTIMVIARGDRVKAATLAQLIQGIATIQRMWS